MRKWQAQRWLFNKVFIERYKYKVNQMVCSISHFEFENTFYFYH